MAATLKVFVFSLTGGSRRVAERTDNAAVGTAPSGAT